MRLIRHRAALLLTGALLSCLAGCAQSSVPVAEGRIEAGHRLKPVAPEVAAVGARAEEAPKKEEAGDGFRFADDKGGQMLARSLPPAGGVPRDEKLAAGPKRLSGAAALEQPSVPLPPNQGQVPRLPAGRKGPPLRPRSLPDELPFAGGRPEPPQEPSFPAGDRVRLPGPDVKQPAPLPVLAAPAPDRSAFDDPTADFSAAAARAAAVPVRAAPAPFTKTALPDPFENRDAARLREPPPEKDEPVTAAPKPPGK